MGRRPALVVGEIEALAELAADLRRVRNQAGNPPYRTMAMRARYSASTLSEAASGRGLPTLQVVLAYVAACGVDDKATFEERWQRAAAAVHAVREGVVAPAISGAVVSAAQPTPAPTPSPVELAAAPGRSRPLAWAVIGPIVGALLVGGVAGGMKLASPGRAPLVGTAARHAAATTGSTPRVITDDTDPHDTGCDQGRVITVAVANLYAPGRFFLGEVWLRYAPGCGAVWTRFEPAPGMTELAGATVTIRAVRAADGKTLQYATRYLGEFVYGNMLRTSGGCVRAEATVTAPRPVQGPATALPGTGPITVNAATACVQPGPASTSVTSQY